MKISPFSTRYLKLYKAFNVLLALSLIMLFLFQFKNAWYLIIPWGFIFYKYLKIQFAIKPVAYDDYSFYITLPGYELQVRFEEVESIEIISLGGVYRINLFQDSMLGKEIYFKPSLLYPLNYKKVERLIDRLRREVVRARRKINEDNSMQLNSLNI